MSDSFILRYGCITPKTETVIIKPQEYKLKKTGETKTRNLKIKSYSYPENVQKFLNEWSKDLLHEIHSLECNNGKNSVEIFTEVGNISLGSDDLNQPLDFISDDYKKEIDDFLYEYNMKPYYYISDVIIDHCGWD